MAYIYTRKEFLINETIKLKDEKGNEIVVFDVSLNEEEFEMIKGLLEKSAKDIEITEIDEEAIDKAVFKLLKDDISDYEKGQIRDYVIGRVVNKMGLDRMNTLSYATSTLQKTMKK